MCCIIFSELKKTQRKVFRQSSDCHAKHIFTQRLVSGFNFTTDFPENVISAQSLSTKFGSVLNFHARFLGNNFNKFLSEKNRREAFGVSSENMLHTTFRSLKMWRKPTPSLYKYNQNFKLNNCVISKISRNQPYF